MLDLPDSPDYTYIPFSIGKAPANERKGEEAAPQEAAAEQPREEAAVKAPESPGPEAPAEGAYDASRWNSSKESLRARMLLPEALREMADAKTEYMTEEFGPTTRYQTWLVEQMGLASAKIDRGDKLMLFHLGQIADRARTQWESDRCVAARKLYQRLGGRDSARVIAELFETPQGIAHLIDLWVQLAGILKKAKTWNESQRKVAFDLMGVPPALRENSYRMPADATGSQLAAIVDQQVAYLRKLEAVERITDKEDKALAETGLAEDDATLKRIARGLAEARRDYRQARDELRRVQGGAEPKQRLHDKAAADAARAQTSAAKTAAPPKANPRPKSDPLPDEPLPIERMSEEIRQVPPGGSLGENWTKEVERWKHARAADDKDEG